MATFIPTHTPFLQSTAQLFMLPVSNDGIILDPVVSRCKALFPDNYQEYRRQCRQGTLLVGTSLICQGERVTAGLGVGRQGDKPSYILNLTALDHPYHPLRKRWLNEALDDAYPKLFELMRYAGLRRIALLARPLITKDNKSQQAQTQGNLQYTEHANARVPILDWHQDIYPVIKHKLQDLPKVTIDIHLPHTIEIRHT